MKQIILSILLIFIPLLASADDSGTCGSGVTYTFEAATGILTISKTGEGTGAMDKYDPHYLDTNRPWSSYNSNIQKIVITDGVTSIGQCAFSSCTGLTSVTIPNSVISIGGDAFANCSGLSSVTIPDGVASIGDGAFSDCSSLASMTIPNSVSAIGTVAFQNTPWLDNQPDGLVYAGKVAYKFKGEMPTNSTIAIKEGTLDIAGSAFSGCSNLTSVAIPNSVISIGGYAFSYCTGLTSVTIPESVTSLGFGTFRDCTGLTSVSLPESMNFMGNRTFMGCTALASITIPNGVTSLGYGVFSKCSSLTSIVIPYGVTSIGDEAFYGCSGLKEVIALPETPSTIYENSFSNYDITLKVPESAKDAYMTTSPWSKFGTILALTSEEQGQAVEQGYAVFDEATGTLTFKYGVKPDGENVYDTDNISSPGWNLSQIKIVIIDSSFSKAHPQNTSYWFAASSLNEIVGLEYLNTGDVVDMCYMFYRCSSLKTIDISTFVTDKVTNMCGMFEGCTNLLSINLGKINTSKVTNMKRMFKNCSSLTTIDVSSFDTRNVTEMGNYYRLGNYVDISSITTEGMFEGCSSLTTLALSNFNTDNVTNMGGMFRGCSSLSELDISTFNTSNVTNMGCMFMGCGFKDFDTSRINTASATNIRYMFGYCKNLTSIDISNFVTHNLENMSDLFHGCVALTNVVFGAIKTDKVTDMARMFEDCEALQTVDMSNFNTSQVKYFSGMFRGCKSLKHIDMTSFDTKNVQSVNSMFERCESITEIDLSTFNSDNISAMSYMFSNCKSLSSINFGKFNTRKVSSLFDLFKNCASLKTLDLSSFNTENVEYISNMFQGCINLEKIVFGSGFVTGKLYYSTNNSLAFAKCDALKEIEFSGDIPSIMHDNVFYGVGSAESPVSLVVPDKYAANYAAKFKGDTFCGGFFILKTVSGGDIVDQPDGDEHAPDFGMKRLKSITLTNGNGFYRGDMKYDDLGRIVEYSFNNGEQIDKYVYSDNTIEINEGADKYKYTITDGRVVSEDIYLNGENVDIKTTYTYNSNSQIVSINGEEKEWGSSSVWTTTDTWIWDASNPIERNYNDGEDVETYVYTYNDMTSEPIIHALFGMNEEFYLDDIFKMISIYPYLGTLPKNLYATLDHKDSEDRKYSYAYVYETNANGDITKVTVTEAKGNIFVYSLEWETCSGNESVISVSVGKYGKSSYSGRKSLDFSGMDEIKAYVATGVDKESGIIWLTRVKDVPAGVPVMIKGEANKTYNVPVKEGKNSCYENMFVGNTSGESITINETSDDGTMTNYYMSGGQFVSVKGNAKIGDGKCYLQLPTTLPASVTGANQPVTIAATGKSSYAAPVDLDFTNVDGLKAFTATGYDRSSKTIWLTRVMKAQKGEGLLLKGDANQTYNIPSSGVQSGYGNMFVGNTSGESITIYETNDDGNLTNFYLTGGQFKSVNKSATIGNNKCYLQLPTEMVAAAASTRGVESGYNVEEPEVISMPIVIKGLTDADGTTGIDEVIKYERQADDAFYNLQGQRVDNPGKGLYIKNGKKVVIK